MVKDTSLRSNQKRAIQALLDGQTKQQAASSARVVPQTLSKWLSEPEFRATLQLQSGEALTVASARLQAGLGTAIDVLLDVMLDDSSEAHLKVRCADMFINHARHLAELVDLAERVAQLEAATNGKAN